ncbi:MAG: 50S ribosomal protein L11 methyltransferase [Alphaproteobacteria bacterium]|nr:50S ribosomal protein L11 methyltransferase [Alphaproteobacteria bacterium]
MSDDNHIPHPLWTVKFSFRQILSGHLASLLSEALEDVAVSVLLHNLESADGDNWTVTLTTMGKPDTGEILCRILLVGEAENISDLIDKNGIIAETLPEKDWLQHVHDNFPPIKIGSFFVYGSYYTGALPPGFIPLQIDAATAFGSGEHETTRGCIQALEQLKGKNAFKNALDMGCGSGILAIALTKLWPALKVTAIDIDPESVVVTKRHAEMNGVSDKIQAQAGDGYRAPLVAVNAPYDIVAANILANPLIEMAADLAAVLKPGGYAVLSGLLSRQKPEVVAAHEKLGLQLVRAEEIGDWQALVLQKPIR